MRRDHLIVPFASARGVRCPADVSSQRRARRRRAPTAPTLATVADEAGVSRQTVSNALNSPELLRPDTLARVQAAIEKLGYSPNRAARNLRTRSSHLVGLRVDPAVEGTANALMDRFLHSPGGERPRGRLPRAAVQRRRRGRPARRLRRPAALRGRRRLRRHRHLPRQPAGRLARPSSGVPFVAFGRPWGDPTARHPWVDVDGRAGVGSPSTTSSSAGTAGSPGSAGRRAPSSARTGAAAGSTGCTTPGCRPAGSARAATTPWSSARRAAHALLDVPTPTATAFVCASDTVAMGALHAFAERGLRAGRTSALVGFDDSHRRPGDPPG